jgi:protein translocase SecG subunit
MSIAEILPYVDGILAILLIACVLLQPSEAGAGGAFGGDSFSSGHHTKRGAEKVLFTTTIIVAVLFVATSFSLLII